MNNLSSLSRRAFTAGAFSAGALLTAASAVNLMGAGNRRILVHGHRGARARRPENTIPAFQYAIAEGVDVLELDVAVTKDDVLVVSHDPMINATICSGPKTGAAIHSLSLAELDQHDCGTKKNPGFKDQVPVPGTRIPTLEDVFALGEGNAVQFNVETKIFADKPELTPDPETFTRNIFELATRHGVLNRMILQSFDPRTLHVAIRREPTVPRAALFEKQQDWRTVTHDFQATILSPEYHLVTKERVDQAHDAGLQVVPWTVDKPEDWQKMVDADVDAIITDDPAALIAWLKQRDLR